MDTALIRSIKALASYAATQHESFRNDLLENCHQLAMEPETLAEEVRLLGENPSLLRKAEQLEDRIAPNSGPISWFVARNLTEMFDALAARDPERARNIAQVLKAQAANRMDFQAIDAKSAAAHPAETVA